MQMMLIVSCLLLSLVSGAQIAFKKDASIQLGSTWQAAGPWPIGTREWPLTPAPCGLTLRSFLSKEYNSSLDCDSALLHRQYLWQTIESEESAVEVKHANVAWEQIRSTKGWSGLQHQTLLRTSLSVSSDTDAWLEVKGATEFVVSSSPDEIHHGNFYSYLEQHAHHVKLHKGENWLAVRTVYDVRSSGDPHDRNTSLPIVRFSVHLSKIEKEARPLQIIAERVVIADRLADGYLATSLMGVHVRSSTAERLQVVRVQAAAPHLSASLLRSPVYIGPYESQQLAIGVSAAKGVESLALEIEYIFDDSSNDLQSISAEVKLSKPLKDNSLLRYTFLSDDGSVQWAMAKPPVADCREAQTTPPVIVALHGAGINADDATWTDSLPRQSVWTIFPQGRSPWTFDWHAIGARDISNALVPVPVLHNILFDGYCTPNIESMIVVGHSNGGQGAWYFASRFPDRVRAIAPAAAYSKISDYVPFDYELAHYMDPALKSILFSGLTPYDNEMHLSNVFSVPILAQHGTADSNVPIYHSRRLVQVANSWSPFAQAQLIEIDEAPHWWNEVFKSSKLQAFFDRMISGFDRQETAPGLAFTVTCSMPDESGSVFGVKIISIETPGQLARLEVRIGPSGSLKLTGQNVDAIAFDSRYEGREFVMGESTGKIGANTTLMRSSVSTWNVFESSAGPSYRPMGSAMQILDGALPLTIVHGSTTRLASAAARLVAAIQMHGGPNVYTISAEEANDPRGHGRIINHSLILLGDPSENILTKHVMTMADELKMPISFPSAHSFAVKGRTFSGSGYGLLTAIPHPSQPRMRAMLLAGTDGGFERALQAFPVISGTPLPEWAVLSSSETNSIVGAGWYDKEWRWSESMSYLSSV